MTVGIPTPLVSGGGGLLPLCARHGEPAAQQRRVVFRSHPPRWTYLLILCGLLPFAIAAGALQKRVKAPAWPFCPGCVRLRTSRLLTGAATVGVAVVAVGVLAAVIPEGSAYGPPILLTFVVLLLVGLGLAATAGRNTIASGYVAQDGNALYIRRPHPRFADQVAALQGATQHQYPQHGYWPPQCGHPVYTYPGSLPPEPHQQYPQRRYPQGRP